MLSSHYFFFLLFDVALRPSDIFLDDRFMPSPFFSFLSLILFLSITIMASLRLSIVYFNDMNLVLLCMSDKFQVRYHTDV